MCVSKSSEAHKKDPTRFKLIINYGYDEEYYDKLSKGKNHHHRHHHHHRRRHHHHHYHHHHNL